MKITIIDDNGVKHERTLSNERHGVTPDEAIRATLDMFCHIYTPRHIDYVIKRIIS